MQRMLFWGHTPPNIKLCSLEYFGKLFVSGQLLLQFTSDQAETWFIVRPWYWAAHIYSRLQSTKYQQSYVPLKFSVNFSLPPLTPPTVYIWSRLNLIYGKNMKWSRAYYFEVTVHHILAELCPFENSVIFSFLANSYSLHPIKLKLCKYLHWA